MSTKAAVPEGEHDDDKMDTGDIGLEVLGTGLSEHHDKDDGEDMDVDQSQGLYLKINTLWTGIDRSDKPNDAYFSGNKAGHISMRHIKVPPFDYKTDAHGFGYVAPEDHGGDRDRHLYNRLMHRTGLGGAKRRQFPWGINKKPKHDRELARPSPNALHQSKRVRRWSVRSETSVHDTKKPDTVENITRKHGRHYSEPSAAYMPTSSTTTTEDTNNDQSSVKTAKRLLVIRVVKGDKTEGTPLRETREKIDRSINMVLRSELGEDHSWKHCRPIIKKANRPDSYVACRLVKILAQELMLARKTADDAGKTDSEQSCLSVGMVLLEHVASMYVVDNDAAKKSLQRAMKSYDIAISIDMNGKKCYEPEWLTGVVKTFDEVIAEDETAEIYCRFYLITFMMFIMWARYDRMSFRPEEVELHAVMHPWVHLKAVTETGDTPPHPLGVPHNLVSHSSRDRTQYAPWVAGLLMGAFNTNQHSWKYTLLCFAVFTFFLDMFRRYAWGNSRRPTWNLPILILEIAERRKALSYARESLSGDSVRLMLYHRDPTLKGCFWTLVVELVGPIIALERNPMSQRNPVSFRGAFICKVLSIEDLRANADVMVRIRIAKDVYKSHFNTIVVSRQARRKSWEDSASFIYATKSIYELVVYDEWVLSIPFY